MSASEWVVTIEATGAGAYDELVEELVDSLPAAAASVGQGSVSVTFSVGASEAGQAVERGLEMWSSEKPPAGLEVVHVEAQAATRANEDLERPNFPVLLGVAELAERLGVSKARASELARLETFPHPVALLASGPVWTEASVSGHLEGWNRKPGRPKKPVDRDLALQWKESSRARLKAAGERATAAIADEDRRAAEASSRRRVIKAATNARRAAEASSQSRRVAKKRTPQKPRSV